jgi:MYXO-CTERM domain-containing protein
MKTHLLATTAVLAAATAAQAASIPFFENFDDNVADGFTVTEQNPTASFSASGGEYVFSASDGLNDTAEASALVELDNADGVSLTMRSDFTYSSATRNGNANGSAGFIAFSNSAAGGRPFYLIDLNVVPIDGTSTANTSLRILEIGSSGDGGVTSVASGSFVSSTNADYQLETSFTPVLGTLEIDFTVSDATGNPLATSSAVDTSPLDGDFFGYRIRKGSTSEIIGAFDNFAVVPEPTSAVTAMAGLGALLMRRRR